MKCIICDEVEACEPDFLCAECRRDQNAYYERQGLTVIDGDDLASDSDGGDE